MPSTVMIESIKQIYRENFTVEQLKNSCREKGLSDYSRMNKEQLINLLVYSELLKHDLSAEEKEWYPKFRHGQRWE